MNEDWVAALIEAFKSFEAYENPQDKRLCYLLDVVSDKLAREAELRHHIPDTWPQVWQSISNVWKGLEPTSTEFSISHDLILSISRFTRNLVAGVLENQQQAFVNEPRIRHILHYLTSFSQHQNVQSYPLTRMLVQTLSNLITLNDILASRLWNLYTELSEDQNILTRLLTSPDGGTVNATLVLILNSINADKRMQPRLTSPNGLRMVIRLLDLTEECVALEREGVENETFILTYRLFEMLLWQGIASILYNALSIEYEPIAPHQITFLKIVDSHLRHPSEDRQPTLAHLCDYSFLAGSFLSLCEYSQRAIRRSLGIGSNIISLPTHTSTTFTVHSPQHDLEDDLKELDLRLPMVAAAMILISQCLTTIYLDSHESHDTRKAPEDNSGYFTVVAATRAEGFVEKLIETLRLFDQFLPRIIFGKAAVVPGDNKLSESITGFTYLKRDLVRLLGIMCHGQRGIQNRIRQCGGIHVIMNLCVIDERNPYMQEHALLALRNVLHENPENQAIVEAMKPEPAL